MKILRALGLATAPTPPDAIERYLPDAPRLGRAGFEIVEISPSGRGSGWTHSSDGVAITMRALRPSDIETGGGQIGNGAAGALAALQPGALDLIFFRSSLERLRDPAAALRAALAALGEGCSIFILAPEGLSRGALWRVEPAQDDLFLVDPEDDARRISAADSVEGARARDRHQQKRGVARLQIRRDGVNRREIEAEWNFGKRETMLFWTKRAENPDAFPGFQVRFNAERPLIPKMARFAPAGVDPVRLLDIGSGPATNIGYRLPDRRLEMTLIDVMAEPFNALMDEHGLEPPVRPILGTAEGVAGQFPAGHFHMVVSRNALDHVQDPIAALKAMLTVTAPEGVIIVWGHVDEAENERYRGYHQWNFRWDADDFVIWRPGFRVKVSEIFGEPVHLHSDGDDKVYRIAISRRPLPRSTV